MMITKEIQNIDLGQIADSGQCFRMVSPADTISHFDQGYSLISGDYYLEIYQRGTQFAFLCKEDELPFWWNYFDLNTDYKTMAASVNLKDQYLCNAVNFGNGIRILRQDVWEMIITFIISQQKTIPKIREAIEALSTNYGTAHLNFRGQTYYSFPTPEQLGKADIEALLALKLGYRAKYIHRTCQDAITGSLDLNYLDKLGYLESMDYLMQFFGIGEKVANCICLFGLHHIDAFPVDTWIQKILLREYYLPKYDKLPKNKLYTTIVSEHFGVYQGYSGVMQQYIFYYERAKNKH